MQARPGTTSSKVGLLPSLAHLQDFDDGLAGQIVQSTVLETNINTFPVTASNGGDCDVGRLGGHKHASPKHASPHLGHHLCESVP